jgi:hypothetical protein
MNMMYSPLQQEYMLSEMKRRRAEAISRPRRDEIAARTGRRWWRRTAHSAG